LTSLHTDPTSEALRKKQGQGSKAGQGRRLLKEEAIKQLALPEQARSRMKVV